MCLDGLRLDKRTLRSDQSDGLDRMVKTFAKKLGIQACYVRFFQCDGPQATSLELLRWANVFWQAGSGGGHTTYLVEAMDTHRIVTSTLRELVRADVLIYCGVCVGAILAGENTMASMARIGAFTTSTTSSALESLYSTTAPSLNGLTTENCT